MQSINKRQSTLHDMNAEYRICRICRNAKDESTTQSKCRCRMKEERDAKLAQHGM